MLLSFLMTQEQYAAGYGRKLYMRSSEITQEVECSRKKKRGTNAAYKKETKKQAQARILLAARERNWQAEIEMKMKNL